MTQETDIKEFQDGLAESNQKELDRIIKQLESENISGKRPGEVLSEFSKSGFPSTLEGLVRTTFPLRARYGTPNVGWRMYPDPPSPIPSGWQSLGSCWFFKFDNGQSISVVIANDKKTILKRSYEDNGDIHFDALIETLRAWQKGIDQAQKGGRKVDEELYGLFEEWQAIGFDPKKKRIFRERYIASHPGDEQFFNDAMKRYKRKYRGSKSLTSD